jgi:sulfite reductase (NADPH) hemoprotein beta-component
MANIVTANRLRDGIVIYRDAEGAWVETIDQALILDDTTQAQTALEAARADERKNLIIDPFLAEVILEAQGPKAVTMRNAIRAKGPTIDYLPHCSS